jgi:hypothetical protein
MAYLLIEVGLVREAPVGSNVMVNLAVFRGLAGCGLLGFRHLLRWCCGPAAWTGEVVADADDGALGDGGMAGEDFFHFPGGQPVAGHIDDVVGLRRLSCVPRRD